MSIPISSKVLQTFQPSKNFMTKDSPQITSLDFDDSGQFLLTSSIDESIQLYDINKGKHLKPIYSKKYGAHLARFSHDEKHCVYASTKVEHTIRFLSLQNNTYIRYFKGHQGLVNSLELSPLESIFMSASLDNTVKLWDLRSPNVQGNLNVKGPNLIAFDPSGLVFAIVNEETKKLGLYNIKNYEQAPFSTFELPQEYLPSKLSKVEFTNDGSKIIVTFDKGQLVVVDAFEGNVFGKLLDSVSLPQRPYIDSGSSTLTPDGKFLLNGNGDGTVKLYDLSKITDESVNAPISPISSLSTDHGLPRITLFNPRFWCFASADTSLTLWTPSFDK
ncbi:BA75_01334T0 [Komagataella pastoris]|uniref:BA75_01334T0 n=1 Tax=Komagataella pastoris TaxID=4922 RepID=A0A1B2J9Q4_PICPA|nr:BA75_01334T0 [Komagataella pastoris]